jgi:drug/metabolite transporter (DMT)-like permease
MQLPFTTEQFYGVFRTYNESVWPAQVFVLCLGLLALVLVVYPRRWSGRGVSVILGLLWLWLGLAYHLAFFAAINPLAYLFAALSVAGGLVFLWQGAVKRKLEFCLAREARTVIGLTLVVFALAVYPAWSIHAGHRYPTLPTFGLPCPTTLFTIGMLAFLVAPYPRGPLVAPVLWCLVGAQAAFLLGVPQDLGLLVAAAVGAVLIARSRSSVAQHA